MIRGSSHLLAGLLLALTGCVAVDATLRIDGSAHVVMLYRTAPDATEFLERRRFTSPNVTIEWIKIFEDQTTAVRATIHDVARLGTSRGFEIVDVERVAKGRDEEITIRLKNPRPVAGDCPGGSPFAFTITLPGPVQSANHDAALLGSRVGWQVSRCEYARAAAVPLRVRYRPPPPG